MANYFSSSPRTSHTLSQNGTPKNVPNLPARPAGGQRPAPLVQNTGRCASCGGGRRK